MTIPPSDYGEKYINMSRDDAVELLSKAAKEMGIEKMEQRSLGV